MNWALLLGFVPLLLSLDLGCTQHLVHMSLMLLLPLQLSLLHEVLPAFALASPSWPTFFLCLFGQLLSLWGSPTVSLGWRSCHSTWKPTLFVLRQTLLCLKELGIQLLDLDRQSSHSSSLSFLLTTREGPTLSHFRPLWISSTLALVGSAAQLLSVSSSSHEHCFLVLLLLWLRYH